jgi:copper chaperone
MLVRREHSGASSGLLQEKAPIMNQTFTVTGMTCNHCEQAVTRAVKQVDPQAQVKIDRAQNRVEVQSDASRDVLAKAIAEEGYAVAQ